MDAKPNSYYRPGIVNDEEGDSLRPSIDSLFLALIVVWENDQSSHSLGCILIRMATPRDTGTGGQGEAGTGRPD